MPLGFERLNERTQRPNALINFIKPLPGPSAPTAELILSRVAAICQSFMKKHHIAVMALEEFPPNNEFVGRNFNAGEIIQLVLKNRAGAWLPLRHVQLVMVHELAHCKEMNHSRAFWKVRNLYADELRALWARSYTGDGMWGKGKSLLGQDIENGSLDERLMPESLCGGTYRSRGRKRRREGKERKDSLSYAERKQRRILRKFGAGGQALGDDDGTRVKLEGGVPKKGKPRVAGSARGRELRAAAALARFDQAKKEEPAIKDEDTASESDEDYEDIDSPLSALDIDGEKLLDAKGHGLVKICEGDDDEQGDARRELAEIHELDGIRIKREPSVENHMERQDSGATGNAARPKLSASTSPSPSSTTCSQHHQSRVLHLGELHKRRPDPPASQPRLPVAQKSVSRQCRVCSLVNEPGAPLCTACSNVLDAAATPHHWRCRSATCQGSQYLNSGDAGRCGVCGGPRAGS